MSPEDLRQTLFELADPDYRAFHLKTCPHAEHLIGVRMPAQRKLAHKIIKDGNYWAFLDANHPHYYEEILITGIIIARAPMPLTERFNYLTWFLPMVNNWAICDCLCASFQIKPANREAYWNFLMSLKPNSAEFTLRFLFVMLLDHFILPEYLVQIFTLLDEVHSPHYYVKMAKAWLIATILTKHYPEGLRYLQTDKLSNFTHNKAIQKARESRLLTAHQKQELTTLKR